MQAKKAVIFESEKAVLQMDSFFKEKSVAVAVCGSNLSKMQMKMLLSLGVEEVILAMDKQYDTKESEENLPYTTQKTKLRVDLRFKCKIWNYTSTRRKHPGEVVNIGLRSDFMYVTP